MGTIWVKEFTGGLDTRRLPVTTTAGVLIKANNGHINRGGEFEKRAAFVPWHPSTSTVGMAAGADGIYTFGHTARPGALHADVKYQQLVHPGTPGLAVAKLLCAELHSAKLYVAVEFEDGSRHLYYDGVYVASWSDTFARATLTVKQVDVVKGDRGKGEFRIKAGSATPSGEISSLQVAGLELLSGPIAHPGTTTDHAAWIGDIADDVNANTGTTGFSATHVTGGWIVKLYGPFGNDFNNEQIDVVVTGTLVVTDATKITGGSGNGFPTLTELWIGDTPLIDSQVVWSAAAGAMANAIRDEINSLTGTSGYSATTDGAKLILQSEVAGEQINGLEFAWTATNGLVFEDVTAMAGGSNDSLARGTFLKTADSKVYAVSGKALYFSGVDAPTKWTTDNVGAGFIDMGAKTSGGDELTALSRYQNNLAVFAKRTVIIEYIDPDPKLNRVIQTLRNTGTRFPNSVTEFGDSDVFYADESGLRSVQSRASTNAAATTDTGVPVDPLISERLAEVLDEDAFQVFGLIEPRTGDFWLIVRDVIYVFALYPGAKISAWTTYTPSYHEDDEDVAFDVDYAAVYDRKVYLRSGDEIYIFGGTSKTAPTYDETLAEAWLPYMDANAPSKTKEWQFIDLATAGMWSIDCAMSPKDETAEDGTIVVINTTYEDASIPIGARSNHISLRLRTTDTRAAKLSSLVVTYDGGADENS